MNVLAQVESLLTSEDSGKDLASVQNLMKKHQLVEADIQAHTDRINGMFISLFHFKTFMDNLSVNKSLMLQLIGSTT